MLIFILRRSAQFYLIDQPRAVGALMQIKGGADALRPCDIDRRAA
jgi:hypothetical protein